MDTIHIGNYRLEEALPVMRADGTVVRDWHAPVIQDAARLLARVVEGLTIEGQTQQGIIFSFEAPPDLYTGLCLWGASVEDLEDDTPREPDK